MSSAIQSAFQDDSGLKHPFVPDSITATLKLNRVEYCNRLLRLPLPSESWEFVPSEQLAPDERTRLQFALNSERPVLAQVHVDFDDTPEDMAKLVAFGIKPFSQMPFRTWVTQQELVWLHQFAHVDVKAAYVGSQYTVLPEPYQLPTAIREDPLLSLSYSVGLVADNHLLALMEAGKSKLGDEPAISTRALWLRAYDRAEMFTYALRAQQVGLTVMQYGKGELRVRLAREDFPALVRFAFEQGFFLPVLHNLATSAIVAAGGFQSAP